MAMLFVGCINISTASMGVRVVRYFCVGAFVRNKKDLRRHKLVLLTLMLCMWTKRSQKQHKGLPKDLKEDCI